MPESLHTRCCIAGGGPAGVVLGFLLARSGVDVVVLEKHKDFLRDFRGDTIHPSTLELIYELGLLDEFLKLPHQEMRELAAQVGNDTFILADFSHLPTHSKFLAFMPQWDFLNFMVEQGRRFPGFHLRVESEVTDLIEENGKIAGVRVTTPQGDLEVRANLTVAADGRHSIVRRRAGLPAIHLGAPMDVLWMRISSQRTDPPHTFGHLEPGRIFIMLNREDYWQCGFVIPKGAAERVRQRGIEAFQQDVVAMEPFFRDRIGELSSWDKVSALTVAVDRSTRWWRPGLLCIGDAAHAMSPIGGVGINLAVQDAVAAANILARKLANGRVSNGDLQAVQRRRTFPTKATQWLQLTIQKRVIQHVLDASQPLKVGWPFKLIKAFPILRRIPARILGVGFRPEHIEIPAAPAGQLTDRAA
jgi:2-polyprenyl-6-methoxyphenol hydroxylase-like FAD-dependent oxidoreductase